MIKPPYAVPTMAEIRAIEPNGWTVATTFAGAGGSSTGYRMAGFRVVWANEFSPVAMGSYRANADPATLLDGRSIREIRGDDLRESGVAVDVLDGSPPCTPFSTQGKGPAGWGVERVDSAGIAQRIDDLFFEFARLAEELRPRVLVAENVAGLVRGVNRGYFKWVLARLRAAGYRVEARLLDASWLGVPQARHRIVFVGVREDLAAAPAFPAPLPWRYTIRDALGDQIGGLVVHKGHYGAAVGVLGLDRPALTLQTKYDSHSELAILAPPGVDVDPETGRDLHAGLSPKRLGPHAGAQHRVGQLAGVPDGYRYDCRRLTLGELRVIGGFPADFALAGTYDERYARIGNAVPPVMMSHIASAIRDRVLAPLAA